MRHGEGESFTGQAVHATGVCMHWTKGTGLGSCIPTLVGSVSKETGKDGKGVGKGSTTGKMATTTLACTKMERHKARVSACAKISGTVHIMCRF